MYIKSKPRLLPPTPRRPGICLQPAEASETEARFHSPSPCLWGARSPAAAGGTWSERGRRGDAVRWGHTPKLQPTVLGQGLGPPRSSSQLLE